MNRDQIQSFIKEHGVLGFQKGFATLVDGKTMPNGVVRKLRPEKISFRDLWEGCVGPIERTLGPGRANFLMETGGALDHTGFPSATEKLISTVVIEAYENRGGIADQLVPASTEPKTLTERIVGFTMPEGPKAIMPGEPYPTVGFGEKYVTFEEALFNKKEGFEIQITEEVIRFDQTNMIMDRAKGAGMTLGTERERRTVRAVLGIGSDVGTTMAGVYYPSGTDTPLYTASGSNYRTNATPIYNHPGKTADSKLEDYTDIQEMLTVHAQNIKDDRIIGQGRPIVWQPDTILAPYSLATIAGNIFSSQGVVFITNAGTSTTPEVRNNVANPLSILFGGSMPNVMTSPYVDEVSSTAWILYDRTRTFVRVNIFPFQVFRSPDAYGWNRDVVFAMRVREWSRCIARENKMAIYSAGA
jgi:hypothetical protein